MSPTIFNILVDALVREMMMEVWSPQEAQYGLGWVAGEQDIVFYAKNDRIVRRNPYGVRGR